MHWLLIKVVGMRLKKCCFFRPKCVCVSVGVFFVFFFFFFFVLFCLWEMIWNRHPGLTIAALSISVHAIYPKYFYM